MRRSKTYLWLTLIKFGDKIELNWKPQGRVTRSYKLPKRPVSSQQNFKLNTMKTSSWYVEVSGIFYKKEKKKERRNEFDLTCLLEFRVGRTLPWGELCTHSRETWTHPSRRDFTFAPDREGRHTCLSQFSVSRSREKEHPKMPGARACPLKNVAPVSGEAIDGRTFSYD